MAGLQIVNRGPGKHRAALLLGGTAFVGALAMFVPAAQAQTVWTGGTDSNWSVDGNWNNNAPNAGVSATITSNTNNPVTVGTAGSAANSLSIDGTSSIDVGADLTITTVLTNNSAAAVGVNIQAGASIAAGAILNNAGATFTNAGTFTGTGASNNSGTLNTNTATSIFNGGLTNLGTVNARGQFNGTFANAAGATFNIVGTLTGLTTVTNRGTIDLGGNNVAFGALAGTLATAVIQNGGTLTVGSSNLSTAYIGQINGATTSLVKTGTGTLTLAGASDYAGGTTINQGAINAQGNAALGTGAVTVANGAALELEGGGTVFMTNALTLNGTGVSNGGALRNVSGTNEYSGAITLGSDASIVNDSGQFVIDGSIAGAGQDLIFRSGIGNIIVSSSIATGTGGVAIDGGTVALEGTNTYTGATTVNAGTAQFFGGAAIADTGAVVVNSPGLVQFNGSETIGSLSGDGNVQLFGTLTTGGDNTTTTFSGVIGEFGGASGLVKTGTGTFTLTGSNTYSGGTTINQGTLSVSADANLGAAAGGLTSMAAPCRRRRPSRRRGRRTSSARVLSKSIPARP